MQTETEKKIRNNAQTSRGHIGEVSFVIRPCLPHWPTASLSLDLSKISSQAVECHVHPQVENLNFIRREVKRVDRAQ